MAEEETVVPWDDQTDQFLNDIDELTNSQNGISIRDLLLNPNNYLKTEGIGQKVDDVQKTAESYFNEMLAGLEQEQKELEQTFASTDMYYTKINDVIASKAASARVPYIQPYFVYLDREKREEVVIDKYTDEIDALIGKFVNGSSYVANMSGTFKAHKLGSWVFSGSKNYFLTIRVPESIIIDIERSRDAINDMLNTVSESVKPQNPNK